MDWEATDVAALAAMTRQPVPRNGGPPLTPDDRRYINCANVQGNCVRSDHYAFEDLPGGGVRLTQWDDDPDDWSPGEFTARVITIPPLRPDTNRMLVGKINTASTQVIFAGPTKLAELLKPKLNGTVGIQNGTILPWSSFVPPPAAITFHGIWLPDVAFAAHRQAQGHRGWREWCDHLPDDKCEITKGVRMLKAGARG